MGAGRLTRDERPEFLFRVRYRYTGQSESERTVVTRAAALDEVLDAFEDFLRAAGFQVPTNSLDIVPPDEDTPAPVRNRGEGRDATAPRGSRTAGGDR